MDCRELTGTGPHPVLPITPETHEDAGRTAERRAAISGRKSAVATLSRSGLRAASAFPFVFRSMARRLYDQVLVVAVRNSRPDRSSPQALPGEESGTHERRRPLDGRHSGANPLATITSCLSKVQRTELRSRTRGGWMASSVGCWTITASSRRAGARESDGQASPFLLQRPARFLDIESCRRPRRAPRPNIFSVRTFR